MQKKPQLKDFSGNRQEKSRKYTKALNEWRKSQKDSSGKRTSYVDLLGFKWIKEGDKYVQYRGDGTRTGKTRPYDINANKKDTKRGKRPKNFANKKANNAKEKRDLKINKNGKSWAADRVGKVDLNSKEYKEAKRINEKQVKYQTKKTTGNDSLKNINVKAADEILGNNQKRLSMADFQGDGNKSKGSSKKTSGSKKPERTYGASTGSRYIRDPRKGGKLILKKSQRGKQLLKEKAFRQRKRK